MKYWEMIYVQASKYFRGQIAEGDHFLTDEWLNLLLDCLEVDLLNLVTALFFDDVGE
jgi:hypothetical protein